MGVFPGQSLPAASSAALAVVAAARYAAAAVCLPVGGGFGVSGAAGRPRSVRTVAAAAMRVASAVLRVEKSL